MAQSASSLLNAPTPQLGRLLIVDDEPELMNALAEMLNRQGYQATGLTSSVQALAMLGEREFDVLLTDMMMPELDGIGLLRAGLALDRNLVGILMTGQGTVQTAVEAMKLGAFDYVLKPFKLSAMLPILGRALDVRRLRLENMQLRDTVAIHELTQAIAFTLDLNTILNKTADAALQQCEADEASIMLPSADGQELVVMAVRGGQREALLGARMPIGEGIAGWVARERGPLTLPGEVRDARFAPSHPRLAIKSAVSIPMLSGNKLIGVLNVNLIKSGRQLGLGQVKALSILVGTAAAALENARLLAQAQAAEDRFRALIENSSDGIVLFNASRAPQYASPAITPILGYTAAELLGGGVWPEVVHPDDRPAMRSLMDELMANPSQVLTGQYRFRHRRGDWRWLNVVAHNLLDNPGVGALVINYRDITERRQTEERLRLQSAALNAAANGIVITDRNGTIEWMNPAVSEMTGYTPAEAVGKNPRELFKSGAQSAEVYRDLWQTVLGGGVWRGELVNRRKDGSQYIEEQTITPLKEADGAIRRFIAIKQDISARKQAEERLRQSEERFRALIENSTDLITVVDLAGLIQYNSPSIQRLLGYGPEELLGRSAFDYIHPEDIERVLGIFASNIQAPQTVATAEYRFRHHDGSWRFLEGTGRAYVDEHGEAAGLINSHDISERKQAEQALAQTNDLLSRAEQLGQIGSFSRDLADERVAWSDGLYRLFGLERQDLDPSFEAFLERVHPDDRAQARLAITSAARQSGTVEFEIRIVRPDGQGLVLAARAEVLLDDQGQPARLVGIVIDVTERQKAEALVQRQLARLAALRSIDMAIGASLDLRLTLQIVLEQVMAELQVDAAAVYLLNAGQHALEYAAGRGFPGKSMPPARLRLGQDYAGQIALERRALVLPDISLKEAEGQRAARLQADGFRSYYGLPLIAKGMVTGVLEIFQRAPLPVNQDWLDFLEALAGQAAIAIDNAALFADLQQSTQNLHLAYDATLEGWSRALDLRDHETEGHSQRVTELTLRLAEHMGLERAQLVHVRRGALLHDIGKMGIPDSVLLKPGPLSDDEWVIMRQHPAFAYNLLSPIAYLREALDIPYCHHEKWDGTGYPRQLAGAAIPLAARIFAVVDVWDALTSDRPYRRAWPEAAVREHIREQAGRHFDPMVVAAFEEMMGEAA